MIGKVLMSAVSPALALDVLGATAGAVPPGGGRAGTLGAAGASRHATRLCPTCGSFLDAPRPHPASGRSARKCQVCDDWHVNEHTNGTRVAV